MKFYLEGAHKVDYKVSGHKWLKNIFLILLETHKEKKKVKPNAGCKILIGGILVLLNILT